MWHFHETSLFQELPSNLLCCNHKPNYWNFSSGKREKVLAILPSVDRFSLNSFIFSPMSQCLPHQGMLFALKNLASQIWFPQRQSHSHWPTSLAKKKGWFPVCSGVWRQELQISHVKLSNQLYCVQSYASWLHYEVSYTEALRLSKGVQGKLGPF